MRGGPKCCKHRVRKDHDEDFEPFFESPHAFRQVFSEEDLFGFDASGIRLAVRERSIDEVEDDVPF